MSQEKTTLEVIAPTVEEAVQKGLSQLNLPQDAVDVEVLDAGSRGLFGLGSRQARIRLMVKAPLGAPKAPAPAEVKAALPADGQQTVDGLAVAEEADETLSVAIAVVSELLDKMKVRAKVSAVYRPPEDASENRWCWSMSRGMI